MNAPIPAWSRVRPAPDPGAVPPDAVPGSGPAPGAVRANPERVPVIELRGVSRVFPAVPPVVALDAVDLDVLAGDYVAIMGTSGSGKSTLLNILGLLDRPTTGSYRLCGRNVGAAGEGERAGARGAWLGFVFQSFQLLPARTATENVMLAGLYSGVPAPARHRVARQVLDQVHLTHRKDALPATMSGGECQRLAIARALAHRPRVLLCDEPTGALDSRTTAAILALLDELNAAGLTIVLITHDPTVAAHGRRLVRIEDGHLREAVSRRAPGATP